MGTLILVSLFLFSGGSIPFSSCDIKRAVIDSQYRVPGFRWSLVMNHDPLGEFLKQVFLRDNVKLPKKLES
jgi:hypothetical protein